MKATRRGFFGILGGAAVGGKKVVTHAATNLTEGLGELDPTGQGRRYLTGPLTRHFGAPDDDVEERNKISDPDILRAIGIPDWLRAEWQEDEDPYPVFDPDLASMKSMSLSAKIYLQKDRNRIKIERQFWERGYRRREAKMWRKINGWIGWW